MFYINFFYFFIVIALFYAAPQAPSGVFTPPQNLMAIVVILFGFWHFNRYKFTQLRTRFNNEEISLETAKKNYFFRVNVHFIIAIVLFALEVFVFDLKYFILQVTVLGLQDFLGSTIGLAFFMLHLSIIWYWGFRAVGDVLDIGDSVKDNVRSNIKFNLVIVIPWVIISLIYDVLGLVLPGVKDMLTTPLFREMFLLLFLLAFTVFAPMLIVRLWDCEPLPPSELKDDILALCRSQGVRFKDIMSWNALNKSLVTAGVMGVVRPFRYLMITPALLDLLDKNEIMAVVSHEVGHVKKKHLLFYLVFFMGFIILINSIWDQFINFIFTTPLGIEILTSGDRGANMDVLNLAFISIILLVFIGYFRFIFGYFMRNFERQADGFCFQSGIDPNYMISSFKKLGERLGDDGKASNWHHYNLSQRIDFIEKGKQNPGIITQHDKKVKRGLVTFITVLILFTAVAYKGHVDGSSDLKRRAEVCEQVVKKYPDKLNIYAELGVIYYQLKDWKASETAYKYSIGLNYRQPNVLNNLAWLLLTSGDESLRDPKRALKFARDAASMEEAPHIMDTLAEAYYQNQMYWEAYNAAKRAVQLTTENHSYFKEQLEKMKKALKPGEK
jgi:Zn-dependent protease with chaperone function